MAEVGDVQHQLQQQALTLHQELSHRLPSVGLNLVVAAVLLRGLVDDQEVFAAVFLEAILERFISG